MGIKETQELNELLEEQNKLYEEQEKLLKGQLSIMQQLTQTMRNLNLETAARGLEDLNSAVKNASESVEQLGEGQQTMSRLNDAAEEANENLENLASSAEKFGRKLLKLAPIVATVEGLASGFQFSMNAMSGLLNVTKGLIGSMFNLAASIIAVPFKMLNGLMEMAAGGGGSELRQAIEDVRREFGDLAQNEARAVMQSWRDMDHFGGRLAETGLSIWRTMGNMAESLKRVHEIASQLGPLFSAFTSEFMGPHAVERLHAYQKGLGLTEEGFRAMGEEAARQGVSLQEMGREITSVAYAMGESFGINGRLIGEQIGNMIDDFDHFGNVGVQELAQVAVYARKLGVEVEKLTGVLDQFADFDKAAESVAQLSQAFGLQLDTLKMVEEQDPAANIERLRKAFYSTGRTIETMTRQERALLAQHTGLDQKTLSLVFSAEKQGMSYEDIQKQGENAEKQQLSQAEAMQKLSNSIERLVKSGSALKGGFFDIFLQGFLRGIRWTREFYGLMRNLRVAMRDTRMAGREVGQMFVKNFPGVREVLTGIAELFNPTRFRKMLQGVVKSFRDFFTAMTKNPQTALPELLERLKKHFFDWFNGGTPAGRQIITGFRNFFKSVAQIFAGLLREAIKGITRVFEFITNTLKDPSAAMSNLGAAQDGVAGFLMEIFSPLVEFFKSEEGQQLLVRLWESFIEMMGVIWSKVQPMIVRAIPGLAAALFGPAFISGMARGLTTALGSVFVQGVGGMIKNQMLSKGTSQLTDAVNRLTTRMDPGGPGAVRGLGAAAGATADVNRQTRGFGVREATQLGLKLIAIATAIAIGGVELAGALALMKIALTAGGINTVADAILPLAVLGVAILGTIAVSLASKGLPAGQAGQMLANLVAGATALAIGGVLFAGALALIAGVLEVAGLTSFEKIAWPLAVLGVAILATIALALTALTLEPTTLSTAASMMLYGAGLLAISGVAFAAALWAVKASLEAAGMDTIKKAGEPLLILGGAILAMLGLATTALLLAAVNPLIVAVAVLNGLVLLEAAKAAVGKLIELKDAMKGISKADIPHIVEAVTAMSIIYGATAAFALAAAGFGAIILALGGGVPLLVGLAALALISKAGVEHATEILEDINRMPDVSESKVNAFVAVIKALGSFAANVAQVINAATPSFLSLLAMPWGRNPQREIKSTLGTIQEIIGAIGTQTKDVIHTLVEATRGFSESQLNAAEKLAPLLNATVELAKAMSANPELTEGLFGDLMSVRILETAGAYFEQVGTTLTTLLPAIHGVMRLIGEQPPVDATRIETFSKFLGSLGPLISALSPDGGMAAVLGLAQGASVMESRAATVASEVGAALGFGEGGTVTVDHTAGVLDTVRRFAETMLAVITGGNFLRTMQEFMRGMVEIGNGINPSQLESVKAVAEIFTNIVSLIQSLSESFSSEDFLKAIKDGPGINPRAVGRLFSSMVSGIIRPLARYMPTIITQLSDLAKGMTKGQVERLASVVEVFGTVIGSVGGLSTAVSSLAEGESDDPGVFTRRISQIGEMIGSLFNAEGGNTIISAIQALGEARIDPRAKKNAEILSEVITAASSLATLVNSGIVSQLGGGGREVQGIHAFFGHLFNPNWRTAGAGHWVNHIKEFGSVRLPTNITSNMEQMNAFVSGVSTMDFGMLARQAEAAGALDEAMSERLETGINAIIENTNNVGRRLKGASARAFNIDSELQTFANNLGLNATGRLEIAHQPIQFNVNWHITLDSAELEKALTEREGSNLVRRDRLP